VCLGIRKSRIFPAASLVSSAEFACLRNNFMNSQFRFGHLKVRCVTACERVVLPCRNAGLVYVMPSTKIDSPPFPPIPFFSLWRIWFWVPLLSSRPCTFLASILISASFPIYYQELDLVRCIAAIWIVCLLPVSTGRPAVNCFSRRKYVANIMWANVLAIVHNHPVI